jgi:ferrochelatase
MARGCDYARELERVQSLVASDLPNRRSIVYQSRSGPPSQPWLEPDILDVLRDLAREGVKDVVVAPIGFVSEHLEVLYDLDTEAKELAKELGIGLFRVKTVSSHPRFVRMVRELVQKSLEAPPPECASDCCPRVSA